MEISSHYEDEDNDTPMPINSSFFGVHAHDHIQHGNITHHPYHHHHNTSSSSPPLNNSNGGTSCTITTTNATTMEDDLQQHKHHHHNSNGNNHDDNDDDDDHDHDHDDFGSNTKKKMMMMVIKYKECQKNHAASMGGNATDGCGEFMPSGEEGTLEYLTCSACNCHRNFHRKEIQGEKGHIYPSIPHHHLLNTRGRNLILGSNPNSLGYPTNVGPLVPYSRSLTINMPQTYTPSSNYHHMNMMVRPNHNDDNNQGVKKRFRTKFSQEQKEKMLEFAEKVGWKIQKQEESVVQQFCAEVGVKRRVLKVWMHNNKYNLAKKNYDIIDNNVTNNSS